MVSESLPCLTYALLQLGFRNSDLAPPGGCVCASQLSKSGSVLLYIQKRKTDAILLLLYFLENSISVQYNGRIEPIAGRMVIVIFLFIVTYADLCRSLKYVVFLSVLSDRKICMWWSHDHVVFFLFGGTYGKKNCPSWVDQWVCYGHGDGKRITNCALLVIWMHSGNVAPDTRFLTFINTGKLPIRYGTWLWKLEAFWGRFHPCMHYPTSSGGVMPRSPPEISAWSWWTVDKTATVSTGMV